MKFSIAIIVMLSTLASANKIHRHSRISTDKNTEDCARELQIPASELKNYVLNTLPEGPVGHCFIKCMFEKIGIFDKENGFKVETIYNKITELHRPAIADGELLGMIENCVKESKQADDACERAYRAANCFNSLEFRKKRVQS
ncbi:general odorant-binding protein 99a-like [Episyrphus balteatus]|uniref:general odorant-binding protein 99a-like n=1 Tax=Episyrphus balteatus TaxID=286459 RepID=UPI002486581A|nr:general odorant-binding protein 99a-like [Episyrphus balteatus]